MILTLNALVKAPYYKHLQLTTEEHTMCSSSLRPIFQFHMGCVVLVGWYKGYLFVIVTNQGCEITYCLDLVIKRMIIYLTLDQLLKFEEG